jgi:hypothetical protein
VEGWSASQRHRATFARLIERLHDEAVAGGVVGVEEA